MATPSYKGSNQPTADNGSFWSGLGSWFGGGATPAYAGEGQPSSSVAGFLGAGAPAYKQAPSQNQDGSARVISQAPFPPGPFAIVVPRGFVPPCDDGSSDPQQ
jgi:hypothetical protein